MGVWGKNVLENWDGTSGARERRAVARDGGGVVRGGGRRAWCLPAASRILAYVISFISWNRCSGFLTVTPTYCCASGHGRKVLSKKKSPASSFTRRNAATSR